MKRFIVFALAALLLLGGCAQSSAPSPASDTDADQDTVAVATPVPTLEPSPAPTPEPPPEPLYFLVAPWGVSKDDVLSAENGVQTAPEEDPNKQSEYMTISFRPREIYSFDTLTSYIFAQSGELCAKLLVSFTALAPQEVKEAATQNYLSGLTAEYGEPIETDGISHAKWEVDNTSIELTVDDSKTLVYFCDTTRCPFSSYADFTEYNTSTLPVGSPEATEQLESPVPLTIKGVRLGKNSIGTPELYVDVENTSNDLTIDAYEFNAKCFNNFDERVYGYGRYDYFGGIDQENRLKPGKTSKKGWRWTLYGFDNTTYVEVTLTRIHATDGTTWDIPEQDWIWVGSRKGN